MSSEDFPPFNRYGENSSFTNQAKIMEELLKLLKNVLKCICNNVEKYVNTDVTFQEFQMKLLYVLTFLTALVIVKDVIVHI